MTEFGFSVLDLADVWNVPPSNHYENWLPLSTLPPAVYI